jgi:hypothetical protein
MNRTTPTLQYSPGEYLALPRVSRRGRRAPRRDAARAARVQAGAADDASAVLADRDGHDRRSSRGRAPSLLPVSAWAPSFDTTLRFSVPSEVSEA